MMKGARHTNIIQRTILNARVEADSGVIPGKYTTTPLSMKDIRYF